MIFAINTEYLTPEEYLNLSTEEKATIKNVEIILPKLGESGFGRFKVEWSIPIYRDLDANKIKYPK